MHKTLMTAATGLALALSAPAWSQTSMDNRVGTDVEVIAIADWNYDELYRTGWSAQALMDAEVYGRDGNEIGDVENILVGDDGRVRSVIIEAGGFLDIGDTHFAVPWDRIEVGQGMERITVPVTEDTIDEYGMFGEYAYGYGQAVPGTAIRPVSSDEEDIRAPRAWWLSELLYDTVQLEDTGAYGYVRDVIIGRDGAVKSVVTDANPAYGLRGRYAYPYYGYGYGYRPGSAYYGLPYTRDEVADMEPFDYERLGDEPFTAENVR